MPRRVRSFLDVVKQESRLWGPITAARVVKLGEIGSTNSEAMRLGGDGAASGTWILAQRQTAGRGRSGREWHSPEGNLHASLVLRDVFPLEKAAQLALVSGVAVHAAVQSAVGASLAGELELKWPNDLLLGRKKLGGILVESSVRRREEGALAVAGFGINLAHYPDVEGLKATSLAAQGHFIAPWDLLSVLDARMQHWLAVWASGDGFASIREAWLQRSLPVGTSLAVHSGPAIAQGTFAGLDGDGSLLLETASGTVQSISFGDVALAS